MVSGGVFGDRVGSGYIVPGWLASFLPLGTGAASAV